MTLIYGKLEERLRYLCKFSVNVLSLSDLFPFEDSADVAHLEYFSLLGELRKNRQNCPDSGAL